MAKKNQQAKKMASAGKSAAQVKAKTGVGSQTAQRYVAKQAPAPAPASRPSPAPKPAPKPAPAPPPRFSGQVTGAAKEAQSAQVQQTLSTPQVGQRPGQVATVYDPGVTPPPQPPTSGSKKKEKKSSDSDLKIKGLNQGLKVFGENGISKGDFKTIAKATDKSPEKIIGKLDKINTKLEGKDKAGINLKSGTANMLVKEAQKTSDKYNGFRTPDFGKGAIGSTLQSMISTPANAGTWIKGQLTGGREADPGFNPGGKADKNRMIGGTVIRPSGKIANKGAGQQYKEGNKEKDKGKGKGFGPYDGMEIGPPDLEGPGPLANPNTETWLGYKDPDDEKIEPIEPIEPEEEIDLSASSGAGGLDLASWATGFKKARSSRQRAGRRAQGLASQKKNPFKSWAS
jgi:hypothetical protein